MSAEVLHGDCRALMADMEGCSVDSIVTDPPYELTSARPGGRSPATQGKVMKGFMGMAWDGSGVAFDPAMWTEALRVLKPGGWLVAFGGARTYHRLACAIEDAGFEIRDQIMWIYGSGFPKGGNRDGKGTCLKPAHEPIVLARKPLIGTVAFNEAAFGTGSINIDSCRIPTSERLGGGAEKQTTADQKGNVGWTRPWMEDADARAAHAARVRENVEKAESLGRWPANVVHDGSDEVLSAFPDAPGQQAASKIGERERGNVYNPITRNGGQIHHPRVDVESSAARFFYCAKATKEDRDEGMEAFEPQAFVQFQTGNGESGAASSLSEGRDTQYRNIHPTVKPEALMRWLVRLITPPGGLVLDPFAGSGSTGKAAILEGRRFIGCELTSDYLPIIRARLAHAALRHAAETRQGAFDL